MKHLNKLFVVFLTLALLATAFTGCKGSASSGDEGTKFTVTFDPDGGSAVKAQSVKEGAKAKEPAAPTKEGLEFEGWFIGDTEYDFSTKVTADITLKAKWYTAYTVTFDPDGGSAVQAQKVKSGTIAKTPTPPTKQGLEFEGWFIGDTAYDFSTAVTANITLKAKWYKAYTITFNSDGGSPVTAIKVKEGTCATAPTAPTKDDYEFSYWINADSTPYTFTTPVTADITLKAIWTIKKYVVTFMSDDWTTFDKKTVNAKETVTKPASSPTLDGYTFIGWCLDNEDYDFSTPVTASITLKAKWLDVNATISMVKNVTEENIVDTILTLQTSQTLKVTGSFDNYKDIADALMQLYESSPSVLVRLDLSATTGCSYIFANGYHNYGFYNCENLETIILPNSITSIGENAFYSCENLKSITIPASVTSIDNYAFSDCCNLKEVYFTGTAEQWLTMDKKSNPFESYSGWYYSDEKAILYINNTKVESIIIPDSITSIDDYAFVGFSGLTSVTIPDGVTSIGQYAFRGCESLASITIPASVTSIGYDAFTGCTKLEKVYFTGTLEQWFSMSKNSNPCEYGELYINNTKVESITIPDGTTEIPSGAYQGFKSLKSIIIPDSVTKIGNYAFKDCTGLTNITIPDSVTSIGRSTFYGCTGLTSITIPASVTSIDSYAFYGCTGLTSITIPASVTSIDSSAFYGCTGLTSITIPDSVTSIGWYAFYGCTSITSITIPASVTSIDSYAFYGCTGLTSITIPASVTSIGNSAFEGCTGLKTVYYTGTLEQWLSISLNSHPYANGADLYINNTKVESITIPDGTTEIPESAFAGFKALKSITIPDSVTSIGEYAFRGCTSLTNITIPDSVTSIGEYAFSGCEGLTSITIPASVTSIYDYGFQDCSKLEKVYFTGTLEQWLSISLNSNPYANGADLYINNTKVESITIPDGTTEIPESAFAGFTALKSITIPDSVTSIGWRAFYGCTGLTSITIPASVTGIGNSAFEGCTGLKTVYYTGTLEQWLAINMSSNPCQNGADLYINNTKLEGSITIPNSVTIIRSYAFQGCTGLTSITIPDSVTSIGYGSFGDCTGLTSITIPDSVTSIDMGAFSGCTGLTSITIPNSVTSIGWYAFYGCTGLTSITIPNSVTSIGYYAFYGCTGLTSATFKNTSGWPVSVTDPEAAATLLKQGDELTRSN